LSVANEEGCHMVAETLGIEFMEAKRPMANPFPPQSLDKILPAPRF